MRKKNPVRWVAWLAIWGLVGSWWIWAQPQVQAQGGPQQGRSDAFTFFIPYPVENLADVFSSGRTDNLDYTQMEVIISIAVHRSGSIIHYDEWEDELEADLNQPVQPSTQIWGDGDTTNGAPPGLGADVLDAGDVITLRNVVPVDIGDRTQPFLFDGGRYLDLDWGSPGR